jgi:type II secretory pathway pseudopilin PulG
MLTRRMRALRDQRTDAGFTLVDLLVSMIIMSIVGAMALGFVVSSSRSTTRTTDANFLTADARVAMTAITTLLRLADTPTSKAGYADHRFDQMTASQMTFYSNTNANRVGSVVRGAPTKVMLTASGSQLIEKLYTPKSATVPADYTQNYASTATSTRVLLHGLGNPATVFTYCAGVDPAADTCTTPATTGESVSAVTVRLVINGLPGENAQYLTSTVGITGALS